MVDGPLEDGYLLNGRYRILRVIGKGGMGTVYQAEHERLTAILAVKEIRGTAATGTAQQTTIDQYEQEARFLVRLNHPNLPKVTDAFVENSRFYLVMDFVEGVTLEARLRERSGRPMDAPTVVDWGIQIADVLNYLHTQDPPIIFRDLKPSNVMVQPDGHIKLIDFGIARRFQPGATQDTALLGSVGYSPPEQFGKHQTDVRSDIYALGATLHHLLTARDPSTTPFKFPPADSIALGTPLALSRLIAHCLSMEPSERPESAELMGNELRKIRDDIHHIGAPGTGSYANMGSGAVREASGPIDPVPVRNKAATAPPPQDRKLRIAVAIAAVVLVVGVATVGVISASGRSASKKPAPNPQPFNGPVLPNTVPITGGTPTTVGSSPTTAGPGGEHGPTPPGTTAPAPGDNPPPASPSATCQVEVLGASPDGKSLRLHVTGEINGKKETAGMVAAYFYNSDKSPLMAKDAKGSYATPSGQLFAEFTFQIDADSKPIDGLIDVPVDQFTSTSGLLYQCIVYSDNKSAGQTDLIPLPAEPTGSS